MRIKQNKYIIKLRNIRIGNICKIKDAATAQASVLLNIFKIRFKKKKKLIIIIIITISKIFLQTNNF